MGGGVRGGGGWMGGEVVNDWDGEGRNQNPDGGAADASNMIRRGPSLLYWWDFFLICPI